jgi:ribosomal protein S8
MFTDVFFSRKVFLLLQVFKKIKFINFFFCYKKKNFLSKFNNKNTQLSTSNRYTRKGHTVCRLYPFFYKNLSFFSKIRVFSKPSKAFYISIKALKAATRHLDGIVFLISTTRGVLPHYEALNKNLSGLIFAYFFI